MTFGVGILVLGHDHISHVVKMFYFFLKYSLYSLAYIRQTKDYVNHNQRTVYQNYKFHYFRCRVLVLGCGIVCHKVKIHYFFKSHLFNAWDLTKYFRILVPLNEYLRINLCSGDICWIFSKLFGHIYFNVVFYLHVFDIQLISGVLLVIVNAWLSNKCLSCI